MIINRFETVLADTEAAKAIHYRLRYQVFCEDTGFEDPDRFPDGMERDKFDRHAVHFIIWDRLEREWVGATRLVPAKIQGMPCEEICKSPLSHLDRRRYQTVEVSRFCIVPKHRKIQRRFTLNPLPAESHGQGRKTSAFYRQEDNEIMLRLLRASFAWGRANGSSFCYFIANRALTRLVTRLGMPLDIVGEPVEHRGMRTPQCYHVDAAEDGMKNATPGFARMLQNAAAFVAFKDFSQGAQGAVPSLATVHPLPVEAIPRSWPQLPRIPAPVQQGVVAGRAA